MIGHATRDGIMTACGVRMENVTLYGYVTCPDCFAVLNAKPKPRLKIDWLMVVLVVVMLIGAVGLVLTPSDWGTP